MPRCPGAHYRSAIQAFSKAWFWVDRQSGHVIMTNGEVVLVIPGNNPINAFTMAGIIVQAGRTVREFRDLL